MRRLRHRLAGLLLSLFLGLLAGPPASPTVAGEPGLRVTYLANEGFLLEAGETKVLVDALFGDGLREYPAVPAAVRGDLEAARGRFADIDLILVSHSHADHFDRAAVARHLRANPEAAFLSTTEVVSELRRELGKLADSREIVAAYPDRDESVVHSLQGVDVRVLNLHHGRLPIENLGLIVTLGGFDLLHVGDTSAGAPDLRPYARLLETVDIWVLPDWLMGEPEWEAARARVAGPTWLINMHLAAPSAPAEYFGSARGHAIRVSHIHEALPGVWVPTEPLDSRRYPAAPTP
ncbi:MAG: MBL fold metallo-hydrolase [Thermoanaerobaculia bacterium]